METTKKILSFHKEDRNPDSNNVNPQSILLDFISSSQTLRIWSFNASIREFVNPEQLQKGKQIDEWWKQVTKGIFPCAVVCGGYVVVGFSKFTKVIIFNALFCLMDLRTSSSFFGKNIISIEGLTVFVET